MQDDANDAQELSKQVELVYQEGTASAFVYSINGKIISSTLKLN